MSSVNTTQLLQGLDTYQQSLERHLARLTEEFDHLNKRWQALSAVYQGAAADDFRTHWIRTSVGFEEYSHTTARINILLQERIDALRRLDRGTISGV